MLQYVESRRCFNLFLNWFSDAEFCMYSGMEFQNKGPEYLVVNFHVFAVPSIVIVDFHISLK